MASEVSICNRALQMVGAGRISALTENNTRAQECNTAYEAVRDAELRAHRWAFSITRASLAADATEPIFGRANAFQLPSDCLRLLAPYPEDNEWNLDWIVEGRKVYTDDDAPLEVRYIKLETDPNVFDPLFREALAAKIAEAICEPLTQSNSKLDMIVALYDRAVNKAKQTNGIEQPPRESPTDPWITARV